MDLLKYLRSLYENAFELFMKNIEIVVPFIASQVVGIILAGILVLIILVGLGLGIGTIGLSSLTKSLIPAAFSIAAFVPLALIFGLVIVISILVAYIFDGWAVAMADQLLTTGKSNLQKALEQAKSRWTTLVGSSIVISIIGLCITIPISLGIIYLIYSFVPGGEIETRGISDIFRFVSSIVNMLLSFMFFYTVPSIIVGKRGTFDAIAESVQLLFANLPVTIGAILGLSVISIALSFATCLCCFLSVLVPFIVAPITIIIQTAVYRDIMKKKV